MAQNNRTYRGSQLVNAAIYDSNTASLPDQLLVTRDPTANLQVANKSYVDHNGGGGNNPTDNTSLSLSTFPTDRTRTLGQPTQTYTVTVSVSNGTLVAGSTTASAIGPDGHGFPVSETNDTTFSINIPGTTAGTYHLTVSGTIRDSSNDDHVHKATISFEVNEEWFVGRSSTQPTATSSLTSQGAFSDSGDDSFTAPSGTDTLYVALPTHSAGYRFLDGFLRLNHSDLGVISTDYTLYSIDDAVSANTTIEVQEE